MICFKDVKKNCLEEDRYINGFDSDGKKIIVYFNDKYSFEVPYSLEKIKELTETMNRQYDEASIKKNDYLVDSQVSSNTIVGMHVLLGIFGIGAYNVPASRLPILLCTPFAIALIYQSYKDMMKNLKNKEAIEKYEYFERWAPFINEYSLMLFNSEEDTEGYEPNFITVNELDSYSLQELKEMVEGIKQEYTEKGILTLERR